MPPDAPELTALLDRYERPLVRYAQSILGELEAARDVVQETFIRWVQRGPRDGGQMTNDEGRMTNDGNGASADDGAGHSSFVIRHSSFRHAEAWLFTVTRHRALDVLRKNRRIIPMPLPDDRPCEAPDPAAALESRDSQRSLLRLLDELTPNQREVIRLKFQNDLSYREIAEVTQLSETNVGFLLHTGLKKLRALLAGRAEEDFGFSIRHAL